MGRDDCWADNIGPLIQAIESQGIDPVTVFNDLTKGFNDLTKGGQQDVVDKLAADIDRPQYMSDVIAEILEAENET